ncbi:MAG: hypothetical protein R2844_16980 [Caldilineales bacterium]
MNGYGCPFQEAHDAVGDAAGWQRGLANDDTGVAAQNPTSMIADGVADATRLKAWYCVRRQV